MTIARITARWTGFQGAPGYSNFYFAGGSLDAAEVTEFATRVRGFFSPLVNRLPNGTTISIMPEAALIEETTGAQTSAVPFEPPNDVGGSASASYAGPTGAVVNWLTNNYLRGRRLRGRTFLVPLVGVFDGNGTLSSAALSDIRDAAEAFIGTPDGSGPVVWGRPSAGGGDGTAGAITGASVPDLAAVLRSRRD